MDVRYARYNTRTERFIDEESFQAVRTVFSEAAWNRVSVELVTILERVMESND